MKALKKICNHLPFKNTFICLFLFNSCFLFAQKNDLKQDTISTVVETPARFIGDEKGLTNFVKDNLQYPVSAKQKKIEGTVYITFVIEKDGSINDIKVLKGIPNGAELDSEAVRIVRIMPNWTPGLLNGNAVRVPFNLPIRFLLPDPKEKERKIKSKLFYVTFNCKVLDKKYSDLSVSIFEVDTSGEHLLKKITHKDEIFFSFAYQKEYSVRFEKPGYPSIELVVTTKNIPKNIWDYKEFNNFFASVNLVPYTKDTSKMIQRAGTIFYSERVGDFDFTMSYDPAKSGKEPDKKKEAFEIYELGVKSFRQGKLKEADSLFTVSIAAEPHVDAFYNKVMINKKSGNQSTYCSNLQFAKDLYDTESSKLFISDCCAVDSFYVTENYKKASEDRYFYKLKFITSKYSSYKEFYRYTIKNKIDLAYQVNSNDTVYSTIPEQTQQPFIDSVAKYISKIHSTFTEYPYKEKKQGIDGTVYIQFTVNKTGEIENVKIIKTPTNGLATEALRILWLLPKLKPCIYENRPIKLQMILPVKFSLKK